MLLTSFQRCIDCVLRGLRHVAAQHVRRCCAWHAARQRAASCGKKITRYKALQPHLRDGEPLALIDARLSNLRQTCAAPVRFRNTRLKLLAGIAIASSHTSPNDAPNATTASISRTPHAGSRLRNC
jgi:hypothetical protein